MLESWAFFTFGGPHPKFSHPYKDNIETLRVKNGNQMTIHLKTGIIWVMVFVKAREMVVTFYYTPFWVGFVLLVILGGTMSSVFAEELLVQQEGSNSEAIVINMESYVFSPSTITAKLGQPITLIVTNQSFLVPHNFLLDNPHGTRVLEADVSSGESQSHVLTLTEPGTYPFYCDKQLFFFPTHREEGMEGRLIVQ